MVLWPLGALYRGTAALFARRGPVMGAASVVVVICAVLMVWNVAVSPLLMSTMVAGFAPKPLPVNVAETRTVTWRPGIEAVGSAKALRGADLATEVDGVVKAILFTPESHVEAGQQLTQLDDAVEQADLIAATANVKLAESALSRASQLRQKGVNAQSSLDDARNQLDVARSSQARISALIDQKALKAPFSGMVGIPRVDVGQYVNKGTVLVTLQDLDRVYVDFTLPEQIAPQVNVGQTVHFGETQSDLAYSGTIVGVDPKIDPQSRLVNVRAEVAGAKGQIVPGQFLRVRVDLPAEDNVIALPSTAVVPSLYGDYVYVIEPDAPKGNEPAKTGIAKQVIVKVGRRNANLIEIRDGLKVGQLVVKDGQNRIQSGAAVILPDKAPAKLAAAGGTGS